MKKMVAASRTTDTSWDTHVTSMVKSCQGKVAVAGVLFWLNYSIHQHALAMDVILVFLGKKFSILLR